MIRKIGVIYQDRNSLGFLSGLRDRLKCEAVLIGPPTAIGKPKVMPAKLAKLAWRFFKKQGVDLVVRFTDADEDRWQDVRRMELERVPDEAKSMWICGVAVGSPEDWLCLNVTYLAKVLPVPVEQLENRANRVGTVKNAITRTRSVSEVDSDVVHRIVREAPADVFRAWLKDKSLAAFYSDCRAAAKRDNCDTPNEADDSDGE